MILRDWPLHSHLWLGPVCVGHLYLQFLLACHSLTPPPPHHDRSWSCDAIRISNVTPFAFLFYLYMENLSALKLAECFAQGRTAFATLFPPTKFVTKPYRGIPFPNLNFPNVLFTFPTHPFSAHLHAPSIHVAFPYCFPPFTIVTTLLPLKNQVLTRAVCIQASGALCSSQAPAKHPTDVD